MPQIVILAGPNGAGKSTLATRFVPPGVLSLNAMTLLLSKAFESQSSFAIESNLANRTLAVRIPEWQNAGYRVTLIFV